jgi:subtilisin family serine protease
MLFQARRRLVLILSFLPLVIGFNNCAPSYQSAAQSLNDDVAIETGLSAKLEQLPRPSNASPFSTDDEPFAAGRILVKPKPGLSESELSQELSIHGGKAVDKINGIDVHIVELPPNVNEKAIAALLNHNPKFEFAEVDRLLSSSSIPNDPYFGSSWHLTKIGAPAAWDLSVGTGVTVAILDSGVDGTHPDLAAKMVPGYNFYDNNSNTSDVYGHGTKCAGAAAAIGNNSLGVTGVAMNSRIMPIRVAGTNGWAYWSMVANGITWAANHGARVASISFDGVETSSSIQSAATYMRSKGGLVVAGIGNTGAYDGTANPSSIISVAGTDSNDNRASWSSYGPAVDIAAPGVGIYTTTQGGGYAAVNGTSFSTPITAGVIALMISANPTLSSSQLENFLLSTAVDLGTPGWDQYYGRGRVDAARAVAAAKGVNISPTPADTTAPLASITSPSSSSIVKGLITISASASDNVGVSKVEFYANGGLIGPDTSSPYSMSLDTTKYADGSLSLSVKAYDAAGNVASRSISVTIANTTISPTPTPTPAVSPTPTPVPVPAVSPTPTPTSVTWTKCAAEGQQCVFTGTRDVRYGTTTTFVTKTFTGGVACTNGVFGDPAYGYMKTCWYGPLK